MFVCVSVLKSVEALPEDPAQSYHLRKGTEMRSKKGRLILDGNCENVYATTINGQGYSAKGCSARRPIVPAVADRKVEDICFISFPVVGTCVCGVRQNQIN